MSHASQMSLSICLTRNQSSGRICCTVHYLNAATADPIAIREYEAFSNFMWIMQSKLWINRRQHRCQGKQTRRKAVCSLHLKGLPQNTVSVCKSKNKKNIKPIQSCSTEENREQSSSVIFIPQWPNCEKHKLGLVMLTLYSTYYLVHKDK